MVQGDDLFFRILVIGQAGLGKRSLIDNVASVDSYLNYFIRQLEMNNKRTVSLDILNVDIGKR